MLAEKLTQKTSDEEDDKYKISEEFEEEFKKADKSNTDLFKKLVFFLNREVPKQSLEFVILCFNGEVYWEGDGSEITEDSSKITHFVTDRDPKTFKMKKGR
jgi:pescadillo protein